jgi:hypothetical protein
MMNRNQLGWLTFGLCLCLLGTAGAEEPGVERAVVESDRPDRRLMETPAIVRLTPRTGASIPGQLDAAHARKRERIEVLRAQIAALQAELAELSTDYGRSEIDVRLVMYDVHATWLLKNHPELAVKLGELVQISEGTSPGDAPQELQSLLDAHAGSAGVRKLAEPRLRFHTGEWATILRSLPVPRVSPVKGVALEGLGDPVRDAGCDLEAMYRVQQLSNGSFSMDARLQVLPSGGFAGDSHRSPQIYKTWATAEKQWHCVWYPVTPEIDRLTLVRLEEVLPVLDAK